MIVLNGPLLEKLFIFSSFRNQLSILSWIAFVARALLLVKSAPADWILPSRGIQQGDPPLSLHFYSLHGIPLAQH